MRTVLFQGGYILGVSKNNRGTPKWMVYNGKPIKMDDLGVPLFSETSTVDTQIAFFPLSFIHCYQNTKHVPPHRGPVALGEAQVLSLFFSSEAAIQKKHPKKLDSKRDIFVIWELRVVTDF